MKKLIAALALLSALTLSAQDRWTIADEGHAICWNVDENLPHYDHIELSGTKMSVVLRYGVNADKSFKINRSLVFPMLRMKPNKTQNNLKQRFDADIPGMVTIDDLNLFNEKVSSVTLNGIMTVESSWSHTVKRKEVTEAVSLRRVMYPCTAKACYIEEYTFTNNLSNSITLRVPEWKQTYTTPEEAGVYGSYVIEGTLSKTGIFTLAPGESLEFYASFQGRKAGESPIARLDPVAEQAARAALIRQWQGNLVLDTPDPVLNTMFAFAKIRGAESIYNTKGGLMHGPGGEAYYAAIWANDQAEYINPFFPWLGYGIGNASALNSYRHFARYMNDEYKPIPSSIISEGVGIWHGAKDRGDGAMIAYGAARYALARGDRAEAEELWTLIEWCLEYCRRQLNDEGVVRSDSDELENRFPSGEANLCTSSLYYDALNSAVYLGKELGKNAAQLKGYAAQAKALRANMEKYFGYNVEDFDTYRYYKGNEELRSWICMPLTVGIFERAEQTIAALFSERLWTMEGCLTQAGSETFWDRSTLYALRGTLAAGEVEKGMGFLKYYSQHRLLGEHVPYAIEAWPEGNQRHLSAESGLYCRIYTEGLMGLRPTGFRSFDITPRLPADWDYARLRHVRAFGDDFDIDVTREADGKLRIKVLRAESCILDKVIKEGSTMHVKLK